MPIFPCANDIRKFSSKSAGAVCRVGDLQQLADAMRPHKVLRVFKPVFWPNACLCKRPLTANRMKLFQHRVIISLYVWLSLGFDSQAASRPNILFLFADDMRADTIGAHGNPHIE